MLVMMLSLVLALSSSVGAISLPSSTSLEQAIQRAFNELVQEGEWVTTFGGLPTVNQLDTCPGPASNWDWPVALPGSDLQRALNRGSMICGYNSGFSAVVANGVTLLDTIVTDVNNQPTGRIVEWYNKLGDKVGEHYGVAGFNISWDISQGSSNVILNNVQHGAIDAACGRYATGVTWTDPDDSVKRPRAQSFSSMHCDNYAQTLQLYSRTSDTLEQLWANIAAGTATVCSPTSSGGGTHQTCNSIVGEYTNGKECLAPGSTKAWADLASGACTAVWVFAPPESFNQTETPLIVHDLAVMSVAGSFFRQSDIMLECASDFSTVHGVAGGAGTADGQAYAYTCAAGYTPSGVATCTAGVWDSPTCYTISRSSSLEIGLGVAAGLLLW